MHALSGGPALPRFQRLPSATSGVDGRPTLVQNVETLARVAIAARRGVEGYEPSSLLTVLSRRGRTVLEVGPDVTFAQALAQSDDARPPRAEMQAVLIGGYGGAWVPWSAAAGWPVDQATLRTAGVSLGAGIVAPLAAGECGLAETAAVADYLAASSARQCGPCLFGLSDLAALMNELAHGRVGRAEVRRLQQFAAEIDGRGGCRHPDGAVRLVRSALSTFAADVESHIRRRRCLHPRSAQFLPVPARPVGQR